MKPEKENWRPKQNTSPIAPIKSDTKSLQKYIRKLLCLSACMLCVGVSLIWWGADIIRYQAQVGRWPTTPGIVIMNNGVTTIGLGRGSSGSIPHLTYEYVVDGQQFQNAVFRARPEYFSHQTAHEIIMFHSVGQSVTVTFNPQNPQEAFIVPPTQRGGDILSMVTGVLLIGLALFLIQEVVSDQRYYTIRPHEWKG